MKVWDKSNLQKSNRIPWQASAEVWLMVALVLFALLWMLSPQEFRASDPWQYSSRAYQIQEYGDFGTSTVFNHRLAIILPTAIAYRVFGVSIETTNAVPLLSTLLIILAVWLALPDRRSKTIGVLLCLTSLPLHRSSVGLLPDVTAAAFMALSFLMLLSRTRVLRSDSWSTLVPIAAVTFLFVAFLAKLSAYWVLPLWLWAIAVDFRSDYRNELVKRFYLPALITAISVGAIYLLVINELWSDPFSRFRAIESLTGNHLWSWSAASNRELVKRLTVEPVRLLTQQYTIVILSLALLSVPVVPRQIRPWIYYALSILLFFWFGSSSFSRYEPLPLVDRMTLPLLPPLYILAAVLTSKFLVSSERPGWVNRLIPTAFVIIIAGAPLLSYVNSWRWTTLSEEDAIAHVVQEVEQNPDKQLSLITSDSRSSESLSFYFKYRYPENLEVYSFQNLSKEVDTNDVVFVFVNRDRSTFLQDAYGAVNYDARIESLSLPVLFQDQEITLFRIDDKTQMRKLLLNTTSND